MGLTAQWRAWEGGAPSGPAVVPAHRGHSQAAGSPLWYTPKAKVVVSSCYVNSEAALSIWIASGPFKEGANCAFLSPSTLILKAKYLQAWLHHKVKPEFSISGKLAWVLHCHHGLCNRIFAGELKSLFYQGTGFSSNLKQFGVVGVVIEVF